MAEAAKGYGGNALSLREKGPPLGHSAAWTRFGILFDLAPHGYLDPFPPLLDSMVDDHPHVRKRSEDPGQFPLDVGKAPSNHPPIHAPLLQCLDRRGALVKKEEEIGCIPGAKMNQGARPNQGRLLFARRCRGSARIGVAMLGREADLMRDAKLA